MQELYEKNIIQKDIFLEMSEDECRGKPCVCPRAKIEIKPIVVIKHIGFGHRRVSGFLSKGKHKVCPYIRS